ncbi:MAG: VWA domain-containing protein [Acidimicrobiales bacterium]
MRFSTVVGHDDLKLALILGAIDPHIGGVLLRGDKGSGKTTIARGLADLLPGRAPFVELPLGATEDRVLGSLDLGAALVEREHRVRPGLLAAAHGGVLFVDEVNLLADHLVDTLLDVAVSGQHRLERDGVSVVQPARFVLIGTMNPEEGELRPQLLDRFGLCVEVSAPTDPATRAEIVRRRLSLDVGPEPTDADDALRSRLAAVAPLPVGDDVLAYACRLAVEVGVEGLRGDLVLCRAAAALAGWDDDEAVTVDHVDRVAPLVLGHRRRRQPFDPPTLSPDELDEARQRARDPRDESADADAPGEEDPDCTGPGGAPPQTPLRMGAEQRVPDSDLGRPTASRAPAGRGQSALSTRGRIVRDVPHDPSGPNRVGVVATVRTVAGRRAADPAAVLTHDDVRDVQHEAPGAQLTVVCLDVSGSMGADQRIELATGTIRGILTDSYRRRDRVGVVAFGGRGATTVVSPTSSVEVVTSRLADLSTGGSTPLADGLRAAADLARRAARPGERTSLVIVTDGRATGGADALDEALAACDAIRAEGVPCVVIDAEVGEPRLGLAQRLAERLGTVAHRPDPSIASSPITHRRHP